MNAKPDKKDRLEVIFPPNPESSRLLIGLAKGDFMASHIARAVEDADARLLNMNVTSIVPENNSGLIVDLRVSHRDPQRVMRSLERYGYSVLNVETADESADDTLRRRYDELMHILSI
ncbi:MAG: hypothetical protein K2M19_02705 [Muribaculaceae bacterium]|nr:hypothetical protein [Muribaculaceae bacterium]